MEKYGFIIFLVFILFVVNGCGIMSTSPKITEEEVNAIVIEKYTGEIGKVEIVTITHKKGKYIVEWENTGNCESGVDHIDDQSGEYIKGENTIC
ncbi:hypothetical protein [Aquibacillus rhizosphaerae]|uniref:Uncharacterized protein n=1 Tax=Aquibacillus rhizosphaerae TaxID=3051431 RepID=A0ABT7L693_9BACI|nr:hypothetical protein [Aquibacillus sp. LR5S19]MDL4840742.1 hypothetical protein [Aquibacillus sp. LR5S19]